MCDFIKLSKLIEFVGSFSILFYFSRGSPGLIKECRWTEKEVHKNEADGAHRISLSGFCRSRRIPSTEVPDARHQGPVIWWHVVAPARPSKSQI